VRDGLYQVTHKGICAGFVVENGKVTVCAPILRKRLAYWATIAKAIKMNQLYLIKYRHDDCKVRPGVEWTDIWECACNGECPACGIKDIEPVDWDELTPNQKGQQT